MGRSRAFSEPWSASMRMFAYRSVLWNATGGQLVECAPEQCAHVRPRMRLTPMPLAPMMGLSGRGDSASPKWENGVSERVYRRCTR